MSADTGPSRINLLAGLAGLVVLWGLLGTLDVRNVPYSGFVTDGNNTVIQVRDASPAAAAGLQVGDYLRSIGGLPVEDIRAANERGRPAIGETRTFVVQRGGQQISIDIQYAALPTTQALVGHLGSVIGLTFLLLGLWAYRKAANASTRRLAWLGISFGLAFTAGPYFASATARSWTGAIVIAAIVMGFATIVDFLMRVGREDAYTEVKTTPGWIYLPAMLVAALLAALGIFQPAATSGINVAVRAAIGVFVVGYFGAALLHVVRNYSRADAGTRESRKLGLMLVGAMVGLVPVILTSLVGLVSPQTVIPTSQYWFLTLAAIPVTFAMAAVHGSQPGTVPLAAAPEEAPAPEAPPPLRSRSVGGSDGAPEAAGESSEHEGESEAGPA